ncbi:MAG: hypothetical protein JSR39_10885 [Verrucomicrobia bacterium]|nr:hypothetical protein [Verrucomicrobiota bacterium]
MSKPLTSTVSKEAGQQHFYAFPETNHDPQPDHASPPEHFFSSSPSDDGYLSGSPPSYWMSRAFHPQTPPDNPLSDLSHDVRYIQPSDEGTEEGISFQGHSRVPPIPLNSSGSASRKTSAPERMDQHSPIYSRRKKSAEDTDAPTPLKRVHKESKSDLDLKPARAPFQRSLSDRHFNLPSRHSDKEPKPMPTASHLSEMYIASIGTKIYFHEEEAATQLFNSYCHHRENREAMVQELVELRKGLTKERHINRFQTILTIILKHHGSGPFICNYLKSLREQTQDEVALFSQHAIKRLSKEQHSHTLVQACISRITRCELKFQNRDTLFRETNLSSALCREYGNHLWGKHLKELTKAIEHAVPHKDFLSLSLNRDIIISQLNPNPDSENPLSEEAIEQAIALHIERFMEFARDAIPRIFEYLPPQELQDVLNSRRNRIIHFIKDNPLEEDEDPVSLSRTYISEALYLRLLHPHLITKDHPPALNNVLISLSKVLQCLAKETPFGTEKRDPIYERLNPLFAEFIEAHRRFVDACSLPPE